MKLGRDWKAVYFANHGCWGVSASGPGENSDDPRDRHDVFDSIEDDDEEVHRLIAAAPHLLAAHEPDASPAGPDFLDWVADRLVNVHGDRPQDDFVIALRRKAAKARAAIALTVPQGTGKGG